MRSKGSNRWPAGARLCEYPRVRPESAAAAPERSTLQRRVAGARGLLLDPDGELVLRNEPLPGAAEAPTRRDAAGVPYVVATNTSYWRD